MQSPIGEHEHKVTMSQTATPILPIQKKQFLYLTPTKATTFLLTLHTPMVRESYSQHLFHPSGTHVNGHLDAVFVL